MFNTKRFFEIFQLQDNCIFLLKILSRKPQYFSHTWLSHEEQLNIHFRKLEPKMYPIQFQTLIRGRRFGYKGVGMTLASINRQTEGHHCRECGTLINPDTASRRGGEGGEGARAAKRVLSCGRQSAHHS